jgi:hypothetical protein
MQVPDAAASDRHMRAPLAALVGLTVALATATPAAAHPHKPVPPPRHWDARIGKIAAFVEHDRGLRFDHPIRVRFLSDKDFVKRLHADQKITKKDREQAKQDAGQLHALGLIQGQVDLIQASAKLDDASTLGFYDQQRKEMVIRGKDLKRTDVRVTVAHELTHALQDQHFNLDKLDNQAKTSGASFAEQVLVEGDAVFVEDDYVSSLPKAEQDAYYGTNSTAPTTPEPGLPSGVPAALDVFQSVPYVIGPSFVYLLRTLKGGALDRAFRDPPTTDEQVLDPVAFVQHARAAHVPPPKLDTGDKRQGSPSDFGAFTLYLVLASRLDIATALKAATGWGGDASVGFERAGRECVRVDFRGDRPHDAREIAHALTSWRATLPTGAATVSRRGGTVELTSCEAVGVNAPDPKRLDEAVFAALDNRIVLTADFVGTFHATVSRARCAADRMVSDPHLEPLVQRVYTSDPKDVSKADQRTFQEGSRKALHACGVL